MLSSCIKANDALRLLSNHENGAFPAVEMVRSTSAELASDDHKKRLADLKSADADGSRTDWEQANEKTINKSLGIARQGGAYKCGACRGTNTTHYQLQTRSADEPMTVFITCKDCGKKWRC